jgi:8-oxo-dGTP pyrophosphatase MutT (NUDIX family)
MVIGRFYAMVGALLWRPADGKYLVLRRTGEKDFGAGEWECVTGRVDQGEGFPEAVKREVAEELGIEVEVDFVIGTTHFFRGSAIPENEMVGVQFCCSVEHPGVVQTSWEHTEHRWITAEEAQSWFPSDHWLGVTIRRAEEIRRLTPGALLNFRRAEGFAL